jgi:putative sporulation protein YtaF
MTPFSFILLGAFAVAQNVDNFVLAAAYGFRGVLVPRDSNVLIAIMSGLATAFAATTGARLGQTIAQNRHWELTDSIARGLLIMLGVWTLVGYFRKKLFPQLREGKARNPETVLTTSQQASVRISKSEALIVATALAIDNLAPSFAFGLRHAHASLLNLLTLTVFTAGFSLASVILGQNAGRRHPLRFNHPLFRLLCPELISGFLIIGVAIFDPGDWVSGLVAR